MIKNLPAMQGTRVQSMDREDSPGEGNGNPLQYSCLENPMDGGAWWATVHGILILSGLGLRGCTGFPLVVECMTSLWVPALFFLSSSCEWEAWLPAVMDHILISP